MKIYRVFSQWGMSDITADRIGRYSKNDSPTKVMFFVGDEVVAEFYCESICGWMEVMEGGINE